MGDHKRLSMNDTSRLSDQILTAGYGAMSSARKLQQVVELTQSAQTMALTRLRSQYGPMSEREETLRLAALWLPRKDMIRFLNWDPVEKGY